MLHEHGREFIYIVAEDNALREVFNECNVLHSKCIKFE